MAFSVNDNGTWKTVKKLSVNDGTWKTVKSGWINKNGAWTKFYSGTTTVNVASQNNINLRTLYTNQTGDSSSVATSVIFNINGNIGSTSTATAAMSTGTWAAGSEIVVNIATGVYVVGAGGNSGFDNVYPGGGAQGGGNAISLSFNVTINNLGTIGGGGGSGGSGIANGAGSCPRGQIITLGGGGAGIVAGSKSLHGRVICSSSDVSAAANGTTTTGGNGSYQSFSVGSYSFTFTGGKGGNLGVDGAQGSDTSNIYPAVYFPGGAAGKAIALNGYTATRTGNTPLGAVS
jgi:hypothetical protein